MSFKSKAQQRYMFSAEARGELKPGTAREWAHETPDIKKLPERVGDDSKVAIDLSPYASHIEWAINNLPHAPEHARQFIQSHPLASVGGAGALAGYGGAQVGRAYQATKDFGKNLATGGLNIGEGIARGGQAAGRGIAQGARSLAGVFRKKGSHEALDKYALNLSEINPHVLGALVGGAGGALIAPEDHRLAGAAVGAGVGGALGVHHWAKKPPPPKQLLHTTTPTPEVWPPGVFYEHDIKDVNKLGAWQALEKFAAFTPAFIRTIARDGDVEIDQPEFKEKCRGLTGVAHLDKMNSGQLGQVAKMLWSKK
jgi:hypothetical protein